MEVSLGIRTCDATSIQKLYSGGPRAICISVFLKQPASGNNISTDGVLKKTASANVIFTGGFLSTTLVLMLFSQVSVLRKLQVQMLLH
jgi:hypothetical protein